MIFQSSASASHADPIAPILFWVTLFFIFAVLGRYTAKRYSQPGVLGELIMGVVFGNFCYFLGIQLFVILREGPVIYDVMKSLLQGIDLKLAISDTSLSLKAQDQYYLALASSHGVDYLKVGYILDIFSRYGVIFLLFLVGVESSMEELKQTGKTSFLVAIIGVVAPLILGIIVARLLFDSMAFSSDLFIGATLCATSVGVTASVLKELGQLRKRETHIILGAAMIDDILALFLLSLVCGIVVSGHLEFWHLIQVLVSSILFFIITLAFGPRLVNKTILSLKGFTPSESKLITSFIFMMMFAWLATIVNLAAIVGAFAAGLILNDQDFEDKYSCHIKSIHDILSPMESILAPLFFMLIGIQVKLETFLSVKVILLSVALIIAAIIGKLVSAFVVPKKYDRLLVGFGMTPRGEVGLIFASVGRTFGVLSDDVFSALTMMIIVTTMLMPPVLRWRIQSTQQRIPADYPQDPAK